MQFSLFLENWPLMDKSSNPVTTAFRARCVSSIDLVSGSAASPHISRSLPIATNTLALVSRFALAAPSRFYQCRIYGSKQWSQIEPAAAICVPLRAWHFHVPLFKCSSPRCSKVQDLLPKIGIVFFYRAGGNKILRRSVAIYVVTFW